MRRMQRRRGVVHVVQGYEGAVMATLREGEPLLVVGIPRSGTSWVCQALAAARGAREVGEPDNEDNAPYAIKAKAELGRFPIVGADVEGPIAYRALWEGAFAGGRRVSGPRTALSRALHRLARSAGSVHGAQQWDPARRAALAASVALAEPCAPAPGTPVVVKSVFVPLSLRWVCRSWSPRLVIVLRGALNTVSSWHRLGWDPPFHSHPVLGWPDLDLEVLAAALPGHRLPPLPSPDQRLRRLTWELCVLVSALLDNSAEGDAVMVRHEDLCLDPLARFQDLYAKLGLPWSAETARYLHGSNAAGRGPYDTRRVAGDEPQQWQSRLSPAAADEVNSVVDTFGIAW